MELQDAIDEAVHRVLRSGWYLLGAELNTFERSWAEFAGSSEAVGVGNGLDALELALRAFGVGAGHEVIVPSNTYIATWLAVVAVGAIPVPVEPRPDTFNIDATRIGEMISAKTRAIMPVHLFGQPADMDPILTLAREHGLSVIADAAQAHGARYRGRSVGSFGDAAGWSFYPTKNLGAFGDAGAVTTSNEAVANRVRIERNYGSRVKYVNELAGTNSRLDDIQAAVLDVKLKLLNEWNGRRALRAARYLDALCGLPVTLPYVPEWADPAWHQFVIRVPGGKAARASLQEHLQANGIETMIHYPIPPHRQRAFADLALPYDAFPIACQLADESLSLPFGPHLTEAHQEAVIASMLSYKVSSD